MPLSDVIHQDLAHQRLQRALASGRVPHAYLFAGPPGVGKEMLAGRFAARLLCSSPRQVPLSGGGLESWTDACGQCTECVLFAAGNHPDYHRIYRRLNKFHPEKLVQNRKALDLSVDVVRHFVIGQMGRRPSYGIAKVFVVAEAERMNNQAQNALLKTLEEPPEQSYIILISTTGDGLLATTRSRCQQIPFRGLPSEFVVAQLQERHGASAVAAKFLAELCQGSLGLAVRHVPAGVFDRVPVVLEMIRASADDPLGCGKAMAEMAKELGGSMDEDDTEEDIDASVARQAQLLVVAMAATILRDVQRVAVGYEAAALPQAETIRKLAGRGDPRSIIAAIRAAGTAEYQIGRNAHTGLVFDSLGIAMGRAFVRGAVAASA